MWRKQRGGIERERVRDGMIACDTGSRSVTSHGVSGSMTGQEFRGGVWWSGGRDTKLFLDRPLGLRTTPSQDRPQREVYVYSIYICKKNLWDHVFVLCA